MRDLPGGLKTGLQSGQSWMDCLAQFQRTEYLYKYFKYYINNMYGLSVIKVKRLNDIEIKDILQRISLEFLNNTGYYILENDAVKKPSPAQKKTIFYTTS